MRFIETRLSGAWIVQPECLVDERGFFARTWCQQQFESHGLNVRIAQCSISGNRRRGTLRGIHYQVPPFAETKLVRCTAGRMYDVIVDLRPESRTFGEWIAVELSAENRLAVYVPQAFAHGFQTLEDDTEVLYQISEFYHPESARVIRWNDPALGINWPLADPILSERDAQAPLLGDHALINERPRSE